MKLPGDIQEGYRFALGMALAGAEVDLIEAQVAQEDDQERGASEDDLAYAERRIWRESQSLERVAKLIDGQRFKDQRG